MCLVTTCILVSYTTTSGFILLAWYTVSQDTRHSEIVGYRVGARQCIAYVSQRVLFVSTAAEMWSALRLKSVFVLA